MPHLSNARRTALQKVLEDNPDLLVLLRDILEGFDGIHMETDLDDSVYICYPDDLTRAIHDLGDILA